MCRLWLLCSVLLLPYASYSQSISLSVENVALREVLQTFAEQADIDFVYNDALVDGVIVSFDQTNQPWQEALATLLASTPLTFQRLDERQVVLVRRPKEPPPITHLTVQGYVRDAKTGEPLPYASIALDEHSRGTATNADGWFTLVNVPIGQDTLDVHYIGYERQQKPVRIGPNGEAQTIYLKRAAISLSEVTVLGDEATGLTRSDAPGVVQLTPRQVAALPSFGETDVLRTLHLLPGVQSINDGSVALFVRGGAPDQNLILLDGMTLYYVDHLFGFISAFNSEAIQNVRFYRGGFPAKYGGRSASVIDLTGRSGSYDRFHGTFSMGLLGGSGTMHVPLRGRGSWLLTFRRSLTDVFPHRISSDIVNTVAGQTTKLRREDPEEPWQSVAQEIGGLGSDFYYYDINSKVTLSPTKHDVLTFSVYQGRDQFQHGIAETWNEFDEDGGGSASFSHFGQATRSVWSNTGVSGAWSHVWTEQWYSKLLIAYTHYTNRHRDCSVDFEDLQATFSFSCSSLPLSPTSVENDDDEVDDDDDIDEDGDTPDTESTLLDLGHQFVWRNTNSVRDLAVRLDQEWHLSGRHRLDWGFAFNHINIDARYTTVSQWDDGAGEDNWSEDTNPAWLSSGYLQHQWSLAETLRINWGGRVTHHPIVAQTYVEPRITLGWQLAPRLRFKGAWGHYRQFIHRIVDDEQLVGLRDVWLLSDEDAIPGFSAHSIAGLTYEDRTHLLEVEGYHKRLRGVHEFTELFAGDQNRNFEESGRGTVYGLDVLAQRKQGRLKGWLSYGWNRIRYTFQDINGGAAYPALHERPHTFKTTLDYAKGPWQLAATWSWQSGRPYDAPQSRYTVTDLDGATTTFIYAGQKNSRRLPPFHRLDVAVTRRFVQSLWHADAKLSLVNLYDRENIWRREVRLNNGPIQERDILMLGFTPMLSFKVTFR